MLLTYVAFCAPPAWGAGAGVGSHTLAFVHAHRVAHTCNTWGYIVNLQTHTRTHRHSAGWWLTPLTPLPCVAFRAGAHVVPPALASILTGGAAHGWKRQNLSQSCSFKFLSCNKDFKRSNWVLCQKLPGKTEVKQVWCFVAAQQEGCKVRWIQLRGVTCQRAECFQCLDDFFSCLFDTGSRRNLQGRHRHRAWHRFHRWDRQGCRELWVNRTHTKIHTL